MLSRKVRRTVKVATLLETLKMNRQKHALDYEEACKVFKDQAVKLLRKRASAIVSGKLKKTSKMVQQIPLPVPESYLDAYDHVIGFLAYGEEDEIEITGEQFDAWVNDNWDWSRSFVSNTRSYTSHG